MPRPRPQCIAATPPRGPYAPATHASSFPPNKLTRTPATPGSLPASPVARLDGAPRAATEDARAALPVQHHAQMTPQRSATTAEELHGALLQLLINTSGEDYDSEQAMVEALRVLSGSCRPIMHGLQGGARLSQPPPSQQPLPQRGLSVDSAMPPAADEASELRRLLAEARQRTAAVEALMTQVERRADDAERERDEFEENAARTLEEELAEAARAAMAAHEASERSKQAALDELRRVHQAQLEDVQQQSRHTEVAREAESAERERKLIEFRVRKNDEQRAHELGEAQTRTQATVEEAEQAAEHGEQRAALAETRQKQTEARLEAAQEDIIDAEERWRASIADADELRAQLRALHFAQDQQELGIIGGGSRVMRRGQAMRFERQLAEAEQCASIEKQRAQGCERRLERYTADARASGAQLKHKTELATRLQNELQRKSEQIRELLELTDASSPNALPGSPTKQRSWQQLALQIDSMDVENSSGEVSPFHAGSLLFADDNTAATEEVVRTVKRQVAKLRGELEAQQEAKDDALDRLASQTREFDELKRQLPALSEKVEELTHVEQVSVDRLEEAEDRAIGAEEELVRKQQLLQSLSIEVDEIVASADGGGVQHNGDLMVPWSSIRRMHEVILSANLSRRQGWQPSGPQAASSAPGGAGDWQEFGPQPRAQPPDLWQQQQPPLGGDAGSYGASGAGYGAAGPTPYGGGLPGSPLGSRTAQLQQLNATPLDSRFRSRAGPAAHLSGMGSSRPGVGLGGLGGSGMGTSSAGGLGMLLSSVDSNDMSTSGQASRFMARLSEKGASLPPKSSVPTSAMASSLMSPTRPATTRPSLLDSLGSGAGSVDSGISLSSMTAASAPLRSAPSALDDMQRKIQEAMASAKSGAPAAAAGSPAASRPALSDDDDGFASFGRASSTAMVGGDQGAVDAKAEAMKQRVAEQMRLAKEKAAADAAAGGS